MNFKAHKQCKIIGKIAIKCQELMKKYPPLYESKRKLNAYKEAAWFHRKQTGIMKILRTGFDETKSKITYNKSEILVKEDDGFYNYTKDKSDEKRAVWFVNFADPLLFGYYDSEMFAQDELQTLELPLLASCARYLEINKIKEMPALTREKVIDFNQIDPAKRVQLKPTPYLVENVPFWISVNVNPVLSDGTVANIYGRLFRDAPEEAIKAGIKTYQADLKTNVIAMAAPEGGRGEYRKQQIEYILKTLIAAFSAGVKETKLSKKETTVIHSGNWGCGAFGGNRELMYLAQIYAASITGVQELVLHSVNSEDLANAKMKYEQMGDNLSFSGVVEFLLNQKYEWNRGDGN